MRDTRFGATELQVSRVCFGTWAFGGDWGSIDEAEAIAAVREALDLGINFFDTAQAYGFGRSEELLSRALGDDLRADRESLVLATKGGLRLEGGQLHRDSSRGWLRQGLEESLRHLGTEYVDLYQVHWPDPDTPFAETADAMAEFVNEGKVRYVGVSNYDVGQMAEFRTVRDLDGAQPPYHMFRREIEDDLLPYCQEHAIGVMVYSPLAHGLLTGKYDADVSFSRDDWRSRSPVFRGAAFRRNLSVVADLEEFARTHGWSVSQLAVAWTLAHTAVDSAIVGARRPDQIAETAAAAEIQLTDEQLHEIEALLEDAVPVGGPTPEGE